MNIKKQSKFSIFFILTCFVISSESCLAFQSIGKTKTPRHQKNESFLTGKLIKLTDTEIQTTVGNFSIDPSVAINDSREQNQTYQQKNDVQLRFINGHLITLSIY